jgi:hypothetical protein
LQSTRHVNPTPPAIPPVTRHFNLQGDHNQFARLAADIGMDGQTLDQAALGQDVDSRGNVNLSFKNGRNTEVANITYDSRTDGNPTTAACGTVVTIDGVSVDGVLKLEVSGDFTQAANAAVRVTGNSDLQASGNVCLSDNSNDFVGQVTARANSVEIVDANQLTVGDITATKILLDAQSRIVDTNGVRQAEALVLNGRLGGASSTAAQQVFLRSEDGVEQKAGVIQTDQLLLEGKGNFVLNRDNNVQQLAARLENNLDLRAVSHVEIKALSFTDCTQKLHSISDLSVAGNLKLHLNNFTLTQTAKVIVKGESDLFTGTGQIRLNLIENDFTGKVRAEGRLIWIVDQNELKTGEILGQHVILRSGKRMTLDGDIRDGAAIDKAATQVILRSGDGVTQSSGRIITKNLIVGGDDSSVGNGHFKLENANQIRELSANLRGPNSALHLSNDIDLKIVGTSVIVAGTHKTNTSIFVNALLGTTLQSTNSNLNESFKGYGVGDAGLAIKVKGTLTVDASVTVGTVNTKSNIYLETVGGDLVVNKNILIANPDAKMTLVAGRDLKLESGAQLLRGTVGRVVQLDSRLDLLNLEKNSTVDLLTRIQKVDSVFGFFRQTPKLSESDFDVRLIWGIKEVFVPGLSKVDLRFSSLRAGDINVLNSLIKIGSQFSTFNGRYLENGNLIPEFQQILESRTKDNPLRLFSNEFSDEFLTANPKFTNVMLLFNDPGINLFSQADSSLVDHNVSVRSFEGLAGAQAPLVVPPTVVTPRPLFTPAEPDNVVVEVLPVLTPVIFEEIAPPLDVEVPSYYLIYLPNLVDAEALEVLLEELNKLNESSENADPDPESEATDDENQSETKKDVRLSRLIKALKDKGVNFEEPLRIDDRFAIRELLQIADPDAEMSIEDFVKKIEDNEGLRNYLNKLRQGEVNGVPRGIYKIIEVPPGNSPVDQIGDDFDLRFLLDSERSPAANRPNSPLSQNVPVTPRFTESPDPSLFKAWDFSRQSVDQNETGATFTDWIPNNDDSWTMPSIAASGVLAAALVAQTRRQLDQHSGMRWEPLEDAESSEPPRFSRSNRFSRRHQG